MGSLRRRLQGPVLLFQSDTGQPSSHPELVLFVGGGGGTLVSRESQGSQDLNANCSSTLS